jgi:hypothetical protein
MKYTFTALALAALSLASPVPDAAAAAPASFKITKIISGGSGCPQGSIDIDHTDSRVLPIRFSKDFTASVGPGVSAEQSRKNCQINIGLQFSPGFQYSVYSADYQGWGDLDAGVNGLVKANYYFSGEQNQVSSALEIPGPFNGKYNKHDDVSFALWSPCGGDSALNVNAEIALTPLGRGSGTLVATKESAKFTHSVYIKWRQC